MFLLFSFGSYHLQTLRFPPTNNNSLLSSDISEVAHL